MQPSPSSSASAGRRPSPGLAFCVSLIIPGGGQIYCGKRIRGVSTLGFTALAFVGVMALNPSNTWWEISIRTLTGLYIFSFIDAYYTALEINRGKEPGPYQNPRVAAVLNLLTHGFGYFYLGERGKGLLVFLGLRFLAAALGRVPWVMELVLLGIAADAYRVGRREFLQPRATPMMASSGLLLLGLFDERPAPATLATEPSPPPPVSDRRGLPQFVPLTLASILGLAYGGFMLMGMIMPDYRVLDQSQAEFSQTVEENIYSNPRYGITMHIPTQWRFAGLGGGYLVQAGSPDAVCRAGLVLDTISPFRKLESRKDSILAEIQGINPNARLVGQRESKLGVRSGYELTFSHTEGGYEILTRFVLAQKGMTLYSLILTNPAPFDEHCRRVTDVIRLRLVLPED